MCIFLVNSSYSLGQHRRQKDQNLHSKPFAQPRAASAPPPGPSFGPLLPKPQARRPAHFRRLAWSRDTCVVTRPGPVDGAGADWRARGAAPRGGSAGRALSSVGRRGQSSTRAPWPPYVPCCPAFAPRCGPGSAARCSAPSPRVSAGPRGRAVVGVAGPLPGPGPLGRTALLPGSVQPDSPAQHLLLERAEPWDH